ESLHVRMPQHCATGQAVAEFLSTHPKVSSVTYPNLPGDKYYELAQKYLPNGGCGVVSFCLKGGRAEAERFMAALRLCAIETHVADARSCCLHPASTTHRQMTDDELVAAGIAPSMVRLSCGLESTEDLLADVAQALEQV
ncbi:MAG: PLP-dependent transferase, partial [Coriobacteriales bacterium]|nr:PLP-dependent transferase [Coriobacteriales bacterium]